MVLPEMEVGGCGDAAGKGLGLISPSAGQQAGSSASANHQEGKESICPLSEEELSSGGAGAAGDLGIATSWSTKVGSLSKGCREI